MLSTDKFFAVLAKYPLHFDKITSNIIARMGDREDAIALDYIAGKTTFHNKGKILKDEEALHVQQIILKLKNAVMYHIVKNR
jgi:hypothetical protein